MLYTVKLVLRYLIPPIPSNVKTILFRHKNILDKYLKGFVKEKSTHQNAENIYYDVEFAREDEQSTNK